MAFDTNATPLTQGFVAPDSPEMAAALAALDRRTPLGACDLEKALDTAAKSFAGDGKAARAIVYIGDGSSRANLLSVDQVDRILNDLVAQRAPVIAFGVGPRIDEQMLGVLAARTGGVVVPEQASVDAGAYGTSLAQAVHGSVLWPKAGGPNAAGTVKWPDGLDVYPKTFPPMRSDRDTVVVGTAKSTAAKQVEIDVDGPAGGQKLAWDIPELKSDAGNAYLATLVDRAKLDGGRTLPLIDSASLAAGKQEIQAGGRGLYVLASEALNGGNLEGAARLAERGPPPQSQRPGRAGGQGGHRQEGGRAPAPAGGAAAGRRPAKAAANVPAGEPGDLNLQGDNARSSPPDGAAAADQINQSNALEEQWQKDVQTTIDKARSKVAADPHEAESMIQQKIERTGGRERPPSGSARPPDEKASRCETGRQASRGGNCFARPAARCRS